ncbi:hypothetical protein G9A89_013462 [Geosiphon pyriformis]|nr:hypothetical protein G9A89_013462 [Geosiphon pyriformis]
MELVSSSADVSGLVLANLGTHPNAKKNCLNTIYSCGVSYKKMKKHVADIMVDLSADPLSLEEVGNVGVKPVVSWGSEVSSVAGSMSNLLDAENMVNMVAKKTSYTELGKDDGMDETTSRKTHTQTYVLGNSPKQPSFNCMSDDNSELVLFPQMVLGSNGLLPNESCATEMQSFNLLKFFTLDIELSAVSDKSVEIVINNNFKKINNHSDKKIIVKKIPVNLPKSAVKSVFSKFGKIISIKMQLIADLVIAKWSVFMEKDSVHVAKAINNKQLWALLYTLPVDTTAHDLSDLLDSYGERTCFIGHNPSSYVYNRCVIVCFMDEASKLTAIGFTSVFKSVNLHWAGLFLVCCAQCKQFGHTFTGYSLGGNSGVCGKQVVTPQDWVHLANIYKKQVLIAHPVFFGGKTWAQMAGGSSAHVVSSNFSSVGSFSGTKPVLLVINSLGNVCLVDQLASLERFLEFLVDQISDILKKSSFVELVPLASSSHVSPLVVAASVTANVDLDMVFDDTIVSSPLFLLVVANLVVNLSSSSSKILTTKMGGLEFKMVALEVLVESVLKKLDYLCLGLGLSISLAPQ